MALDAITNSGILNELDTSSFFNSSYTEDDLSPIDSFIKNTNELNIIISSTTPDHVVASLLLLGYMSVVESYMRAMTRRVINIDGVAQKKVESREVTFGAAIHHKVKMMPEALLEHKSLAGESGVKLVLRELLSIKGNLPPYLKGPLVEYKKICQLRHCVVHRFGKLGANNAISLGLDKHKNILEKPLLLDVTSLTHIAESLRCFVKSLNNYIFFSLLERTVKNKDDNGNPLYPLDWYWKYNRDRKRFNNYYDIFSSKLDTVPSLDVRSLYEEFKSEYKTIP